MKPKNSNFVHFVWYFYDATIALKSIIQIFDMLSINKFHWNFAPCISGILIID